jgi:predicted secreted protein
MADTKIIGNDFFLRLVIGAETAYIVCEQNSELSLSAEAITVLCKTTGAWPEILAGGTKSGSFSFTGAYLKDPTSPNLSAFELIQYLGTVQEYIWGGIVAGDDQVTGEAHVTDLSIASNTNEAITFTATLTLSGEPTASKVSS